MTFIYEKQRKNNIEQTTPDEGTYISAHITDDKEAVAAIIYSNDQGHELHEEHQNDTDSTTPKNTDLSVIGGGYLIRRVVCEPLSTYGEIIHQYLSYVDSKLWNICRC